MRSTLPLSPLCWTKQRRSSPVGGESLPFLVSALLALLPVAVQAAPRVAVPPFRVTGSSSELAEFAADRTGQLLRERGFTVTTADEVQALMSLERQKQLLGCDDGSSCTAELAAALGADIVAVGRLSRLGTRLEVDVKLVDAKTSAVKAQARDSITDDGDLQAALERIVAVLAPLPARSPWPAVTMGLGGALAGTGAVLLALAVSGAASFPVQLYESERDFQRAAQPLLVQRGLGVGLVVGGLAVSIAGLVWALVAKPEEQR